MDSVKITPGADGKAPTVDFAKPLAIPQIAMKLVTQGSGETVTAGQEVTLRSAAYSAADGSTTGENFSQAAGAAFLMDDSFKAQNALPYNVIVGAKVGAYLAFGAPEQPAAQGAPAQPATVVVYYIESAKTPPPLPTLASPEESKQLDSEGKLPSATFDDKGVPSIQVPAVDPPANLVVKVLKEGTGDVLTSSDSANVEYTGWKWTDPSQPFDSNYGKGSPFKVSLSGGVIKGWLMGLVDQKVGSTVMLVIPAALGYGENPSGGQPGGTLVFVVNIQAKA